MGLIFAAVAGDFLALVLVLEINTALEALIVVAAVITSMASTVAASVVEVVVVLHDHAVAIVAVVTSVVPVIMAIVPVVTVVVVVVVGAVPIADMTVVTVVASITVVAGMLATVLELIFNFTSFSVVTLGELSIALLHSAVAPLIARVPDGVPEDAVSPLTIELAAAAFAAVLSIASLISVGASVEDAFVVRSEHVVYHAVDIESAPIAVVASVPAAVVSSVVPAVLTIIPAVVAVVAAILGAVSSRPESRPPTTIVVVVVIPATVLVSDTMAGLDDCVFRDLDVDVWGGNSSSRKSGKHE